VVVRSCDGTPLVNVAVRACSGPDSVGRRAPLAGTHSDAEGRFHFGPEVVALAPRSLDFTWFEQRTQCDFDVVRSAPTGRHVKREVPLPLAPNLPDGLRVELDTGWRLHGRLVSPDGRPLGGVPVGFPDATGERSVPPPATGFVADLGDVVLPGSEASAAPGR
jgi:hypothetical protein